DEPVDRGVVLKKPNHRQRCERDAHTDAGDYECFESGNQKSESAVQVEPLPLIANLAKGLEALEDLAHKRCGL
ncbi:MAG: hypothetical protein RLZZ594_234, partial [Actinomycetota bacterium]